MADRLSGSDRRVIPFRAPTSDGVPRDEVAKAIREAIVAGGLQPGEKLSEECLGKRFRLSRTPVREALLRLEKEGFVSLIPNRGAFVGELSPRDIEELYLVKEVLEGLVTRLAAQRMSVLDLRQVQALVGRMRRAAARRDALAYRRLHREYTALMNALQGNRWLAEIYELVVRHIERIEMRTFTVRRIGASIREHERILGHIVRHEEGAAEEAAREHQRSALKDLLAELARQSRAGALPAHRRSAEARK